tara:strand:- start:2968 stop:4131 length:1164 start_codon:yes stop_codon:yes gene_type:complete
MKILIVLRNIGPYHNSRFEALSKLKIKVNVFETRPKSQEYLWGSIDKYKYNVYKFPNNLSPEEDIPNRKIDLFYEKLIPQIKPNAIISVGWADRSYQRLLLYGNINKIPVLIVSDSIIRTENNRKRPFLKEFIKKIILKGYSSAFVAGTESKNYLLRLGFDRKRIFSPWDVIDNNFYEKYIPENNISKNNYFLCVSRLIKRKNLINLIKSFAYYQECGGKWGLKIIGSGDEYNKLMEESKKISNKDNFEIINWLQIEKLVKYYKNASAFILPSYFDTWGLVVNEAIASGLPCIVSENCGCAADLINNNISGLIFDPYDLNELSYCMKLIENQDEKERQKMIKFARINLDKFDLNNFSINLKKAINQAINKPKFSILSALFLRITSCL